MSHFSFIVLHDIPFHDLLRLDLLLGIWSPHTKANVQKHMHENMHTCKRMQSSRPLPYSAGTRTIRGDEIMALCVRSGCSSLLFRHCLFGGWCLAEVGEQAVLGLDRRLLRRHAACVCGVCCWVGAPSFPQGGKCSCAHTIKSNLQWIMI